MLVTAKICYRYPDWDRAKLRKKLLCLNDIGRSLFARSLKQLFPSPSTNPSIVNAHLDVLAGGLAAPLELAALELEVEVVAHVPGHDDVGEAELFRQADVLEEQGILVAHLAELAVEHAERDDDAVVRLARQGRALVVTDYLLVQLVELLLVALVDLASPEVTEF